MQQLSRQGKKADITSQGMWNYINWDCSVEMSDQCYAMIQKATKSTSHKSLGNKLRKHHYAEVWIFGYPHQQLFMVLVSVSKKMYQCLKSIRKWQKG